MFGRLSKYNNFATAGLSIRSQTMSLEQTACDGIYCYLN